jgi:hypothetical protein
MSDAGYNWRVQVIMKMLVIAGYIVYWRGAGYKGVLVIVRYRL